MGAEAYTWVTKYRKNLADALRTAREETFAAGKFIGADEHPATMEEAVELGAEAGTGSILDITGVSECPELCSVCPLTSEELIEFFGTERPTFAQIEQCAPFWESFNRGEARAVTLYKNGKPSQICFAGWTIDAPAAGSGSFEEAKGKRPGAKNGKTLPSAITPEERAADLAFFKTFIDEYEQAFAAGNIKDFSEQHKRMVSIFTKYQNDMEFLQSILSIRPDIVAKALAGGSTHGNH